MEVNEFDINMVLSNLLMNAYEAIQICESKEIKVSMRYDRGMLKIQVINTYNGVIKKEKEEFLTTKEEAEEHGIGLVSVRKIVDKYKGNMTIDAGKEEIKVDILLFV